uniref:YopX domain-containing protein n=1 Tax=Bursaphelenchus xylophilus TaxID=6326 RepID=A0A1I7RUH8_BURXY
MEFRIRTPIQLPQAVDGLKVLSVWKEDKIDFMGVFQSSAKNDHVDKLDFGSFVYDNYSLRLRCRRNEITFRKLDGSSTKVVTKDFIRCGDELYLVGNDLLVIGEAGCHYGGVKDDWEFSPCEEGIVRLNQTNEFYNIRLANALFGCSIKENLANKNIFFGVANKPSSTADEKKSCSKVCCSHLGSF